MFNRKIGTISWKIHRPYEGMAIGGGTPTYTKEVTGNGYIDLTDAVVNKLLELKAYGGCTQASTPTPSTPVDIVCNNGALKVRKESGLPFRYKKVEYITASSTQWLNTGIKLASTDIVEAEYKNSSSSGYGALYGVFAMGDSSAFYANGTYYGYDVLNNKVNTGVDVDTSRHTLRHDFVNGIITLDDTTTTFTAFTFDNSKDNYLFSRYYNTSYGYGFKGSCRKYRIYRGGELICDLIPVIDTQNNNEPGMYDLVSGKFRGNVGTGNFTAGAEAQDDVKVYVDGTTETINVHGKNLFDKALFNTDVGDTITYTTLEIPNGTYTMSTNFPISNNVTNVFIFAGEVTSGAATVMNGVYDGQSQTITVTDGKYTVAYRSTTSSSSNTNNPKDYDFQLELGSTATTYEPYYNGGTATCEDLLGVGTYKDEQEILSGNVITKVGVFVLTGNESWVASSAFAGSCYWLPQGATNIAKSYVGLCSHFESASSSSQYARGKYLQELNAINLWYSDNKTTAVADLKQFLAEQYNAGTPVIVVYALETPKTLSVAGQSLSIPAGNSRIEIVEGSILNLPLYAKYKSTTE